MNFFSSKKKKDKLWDYAAKIINFRDHVSRFILFSLLFVVLRFFFNKRLENLSDFFRPVYPIAVRIIILILHYISLRRTNPVKAGRIEKEYQKLLHKQKQKEIAQKELEKQETNEIPPFTP